MRLEGADGFWDKELPESRLEDMDIPVKLDPVRRDVPKELFIPDRLDP